MWVLACPARPPCRRHCRHRARRRRQRLLTADFLEQIARLIEHMQPALGTDDARFAEQTQAVVKALRRTDADLMETKMLLANYSHRVSFTAEG